MPYKVVQTVEKGKPVLTAVPHSWEKEGTLYWPKYQAEKLVKVEDICPEDSWIPIACELKRDHLSYEEAQVEISSMLYRGVSGNEQSNRRLSEVEPSTSSHSKTIEIKLESSMQDPLVCDEETPMVLSAGMELILENQKILLENQKKMMRKIAEFTSRLDTVTSMSSEIPSCNTGIPPNNFFSLIDSQEALDELENDLKDSGKRNALYDKFSGICIGQGKNSSYFLVDMLFTRKFMTKCSWAGGSRTEETKIPFKIYKNIINFFQNVVYKTDQTFTIFECHNFFKTVLKNAHQRSESKGLRAPHRKTRSKHLSMEQILYVNENDGDEYEEIHDGLETSLEARAEYSHRKRKRMSYVETSEGETDVERELNESSGTLGEVKK